MVASIYYTGLTCVDVTELAGTASPCYGDSLFNSGWNTFTVHYLMWLDGFSGRSSTG